MLDRSVAISGVIMYGASVLVKRVGWNFIGSLVPAILAIPAIGYLARALGIEEFGLFILIYALLGYASIFDMGVSRAVIREVAINKNEPQLVARIIGTSTMFLFLVGSVVTIIFLNVIDVLIQLLEVSIENNVSAIMGMKIFGLAIVPFLVSTIWLSYLEGIGDFERLNKLKMVVGSLMVLMPVLFVSISRQFESAVLGVLGARLISLFICYFFSVKKIEAGIFSFSLLTLKRLLSFGGWVTVSNIISPVMVYFDRFIISNILGAKAAAFYTAPAELVGRMTIVPTSISRVIFQSLSSNSDVSGRLLEYLMIVLAGLLSITVFFGAEYILEIWLGAEYVSESTNVLKVLTLGFFFNSLAQIPFARIQALGYSKLTAAIHLFELLPYLVLLYVFIAKFELVGAAMAWSIRVTVDYVILEFFSKRLNIPLYEQAR